MRTVRFNFRERHDQADSYTAHPEAGRNESLSGEYVPAEVARALLAALRRAEPGLWLLAASGNADAVAMHRDADAAIAGAEGR